MKMPTPECYSLASRVLAHGAGDGQQTAELAEAAERACWKLHAGLALKLGPEGFRVLFARALGLAKAEFPFFERVEIESHPEACLKGLAETTQGLDSAEVRRGIVALLANFIWLLRIFIGEELANRNLARIWPGVPLHGPGEGPQEVKE